MYLRYFLYYYSMYYRFGDLPCRSHVGDKATHFLIANHDPLVKTYPQSRLDHTPRQCVRVILTSGVLADYIPNSVFFFFFFFFFSFSLRNDMRSTFVLQFIRNSIGFAYSTSTVLIFQAIHFGMSIAMLTSISESI
jgi:hypothetical protein